MSPVTTKPLSQLLLANMLLVATLSCILVGCLWVAQETLRFNADIVAMRDRMISARKNKMKEEVNSAISYLRFMRRQTEARTRSIIRERVNEAYQIASHLHSRYAATKSQEELETLVRETLRPIRFNNGRGYFFATRLDGVEQLCATCTHLENTDLSGLQDTRGAYVIRDMVKLVEKDGEGYYSYTWGKPDTPGQDFVKTSFVKLFQPFGWLIGAGEYLDDVEEDLKREAIQWIRDIRYEGDGYIFVGDWQGTSLSGPAVGRNMYEVADQNGVKIVQEMIKAARNGGGFVDYVMPKLEGQRPEPKISYAAGLPEWQWYIGTGLYIDDIERDIAEYRRQSMNDLLFNILKILASMLILWLGAFFLVTRLDRKTRRMLASFSQFFARGEHDNLEIPVDEMSVQEFRELADAANRMIAERKSAEEALREKTEELERYFTASLDMLCIATTEGQFVRLNPEWEKVLGYPTAELEGRSFLELVHPDDLDATLAAVRTLNSQHDVLNFENRYCCADGSYRWIEWRSRARGNLIHAVARDITDRKRTEQELRRSEARLKDIFENMPNGYYLSTREGKFIDVNPAFVKMLGYDSREELLQVDIACDLYVSPDERDQYIEESQNPEFLSASHPEQYRLKRKDGRIILVEDHSRYLRDEQGNVICHEGICRDVTEREMAEEMLKASEETFRNIVQASPMGIHLYRLEDDDRLVFVGANPAADRLLGVDNRQFIGKTVEEAFPPLINTEIPSRYRRAAREGEHWQTEQIDYSHGRIKGAFEVHAFQMSPGNAAVLFNEITSRKKAEEERQHLQEQLVHAQKMESVGRLAGGVAHDFNNMLGVILGHTELALRGLDPAHPLFGSMTNIRKAAERSADLTRQLLAFARKQTVTPRVLHLNETVKGMLDMLRRLIGEDINLVWIPDPNAGNILIDPSQIDQILVNLCVNARDAIGDTGRITIETQRTFFDRDFCLRHPDAIPGDYAALLVRDNGCGMDADTRSHLFEPFFTSKPVGKGTGLGLATVYGIIKQNNGFIDVESEPGKGTVFRIYLPRHSTGIEQKTEIPAEQVMLGDETILVVEDEPMILEMAVTVLTGLGYTVLQTTTPTEAIRLAGENPDAIDLLLTDVILPEMNGLDLARTLEGIRPGLRCLFMSGYTADTIAHHGVLEEGVHFIQKPFSTAALAVKVREVLDQ
jgi:PAS domain S-box-containing protein